ncbi:hypothetical protein [Corynebacterium testudinoris]|uniref:Uncharacterized protein n=1 Tax=Corynebacterium testudinoris TaxID=136857 RepID=A0A0G3H4H8_9CORY|nr:hypothetical protein [Corynebacterium testudinoris]AKK07620.1 hypothetical protein CTEST_00750 [Corynebacterium testudinoris]
MEHPLIAVVDKQPDCTVVWHVQTAPDGPSASGMLAGAWIVGDGFVDPDRLGDLTASAYVLDTAQPLTELVGALLAAVADIKAAVTAAKEDNPKLTAPVWAVPSGTVDAEKLRDAYRGEPVAENAWVYATAVAELVEAWHTIEGQRRSRKFLQEALGAQTRPFPLP